METTIDADNNTVSIITTHFSKYMVVDRQDWFDNWREIYAKFESLSERKPSITAICVDCSGSMAWNDSFFSETQYTKTCYRNLAVQQFVNAMFDNDKTSIITFVSSAYEKCSLTSDKEKLIKNAVFSSNGGTNANSAINIALNELIGVYGNKSIILLSDGDVNVSVTNIDKASDNGIKIHCIALGEGANSTSLKQYAEKTDGEFFIAESSSGLKNIYDSLSAKNQLNFDYLSDTDKDGVPDYIEISGIPLPNGKLVFSNPNKWDTDDDEISDGDEVGKMSRSYVPTGVPEKGLIYKFNFKVVSDPTMQDSDGDGYDDFYEVDISKTNPLKEDVKWYGLLNDYTSIVESDGTISYGGNQSWSYNYNRPYDLKIDLNSMGCGVIASCDTLLYLQKTRNHAEISDVQFNENGTIGMDIYLSFVENYYSLYRSTMLGVIFPSWNRTTAKELDTYFNTYYDKYWTRLINSKLCASSKSDSRFRYSWIDDSYNGFLNIICNSLEDDIPFILSTTNFISSENGVSMYFGLLTAGNENTNKLDNIDTYNHLREHAVTITGIIDDQIKDDAIIILSSWGEKYYISYKELKEKTPNPFDLYGIEIFNPTN